MKCASHESLQIQNLEAFVKKWHDEERVNGENEVSTAEETVIRVKFHH